MRAAATSGRICAVNYGYSGYSLVRHMRAMVARGDLGRVRLVVAEFAHGHHADAADADNPRVRWRYDPAQAGVSAQFADCGIHALHLASFVVGQEVATLSADFASCVEGRQLEDDAMVDFRMDGGTIGRLWTSSIAIGRQHGLTLQVFGERGGLRWAQEQPNQLYWTPVGRRTEILERGEAGLSPEADRASRVTIGHAEGMPLAFANIYADLAEAIAAARDGRPGGSRRRSLSAGGRRAALHGGGACGGRLGRTGRRLGRCPAAHVHAVGRGLSVPRSTMRQRKMRVSGSRSGFSSIATISSTEELMISRIG